MTYDFWTEEASVDGRRGRLSELPAKDAAEVTDLVHFWELAIAARARSAPPAD